MFYNINEKGGAILAVKQKHIGYVRVSTEAQAEEGYSIGEQSNKLERFFGLKGVEDFEIYVDAGFSGSNLSRPKITQIIEEAARKEIKQIVVYKLDRLSRSQKDTLYLIEDVFLPNNIDFVSINENLDTGTPYGRAMIGIMSAFAQLERENIFMRTRMGMIGRVKEGYWPGGGNIPYGYDYDRNQGILVPNELAANVKQMYDLYIAGFSCQSIADMFGLKYERLVTQILTRKSNTGCIVYKGVEYQGKHQAIIDLETYELAMRKMSERSELRTVKNREPHLLTGLCYCGICGAKMRYQKWGKNGCKLVCYSSDPSKPYLVKDENCNAEKVWAEPVEEIVIQDLFRLAANIQTVDFRQVAILNPLQVMEGRAKNIKSKIKKLYNLYAESDNELLLDTIKENELELHRLEKEIKDEIQFNVVSNRIQVVKQQMYDIKHNWESMSFYEQQMIVRDVVEKIVIKGDKIDIYYKFDLESESIEKDN